MTTRSIKDIRKNNQEQSKFIKDILQVLNNHFTPGQLNVFGPELTSMLLKYEQNREKEEQRRLDKTKAQWQRRAKKNLGSGLDRQKLVLEYQHNEFLADEKEDWEDKK